MPELTREKWLEERNKAIGCSEIGAILDFYYPPNLSKGEEVIEPRFNAMDVWLRKTGRAEHKEPSRAMEWGNIVEDAIAQEYALRTKHGLQRCQFVQFKHPDAPLRGTPDYLLTDVPGGLECKNIGQWSTFSVEDGKVEHAFRVQCNGYLMVVPDREWWDVAACLRGSPADPVRILPNPNLQDTILDSVSRFWREYVIADKPPVCDQVMPSHDQVKRIYVRGTEESITATPEIEDLMSQYMDYKKQEKLVKDGLERTRVPLELFMGVNKLCVGSRTEASWTNNKDSEKFDDAAYISALETKLYDDFGVSMDDLRRIRAQHTQITAGARVLRVKERKNVK
jgi:predicted phage-related endonuclease